MKGKNHDDHNITNRWYLYADLGITDRCCRCDYRGNNHQEDAVIEQKQQNTFMKGKKL